MGTGWTDDRAGLLHALRNGIESLIFSSKPLPQRLDEATELVVHYSTEDFTDEMVPVFQRILEARRKALGLSLTNQIMAFELMKRSEQKQVAQDLLTLFQAFLIDLGRGYPEFDYLYPKASLPEKPKRRRRKEIPEI